MNRHITVLRKPLRRKLVTHDGAIVLTVHPDGAMEWRPLRSRQTRRATLATLDAYFDARGVIAETAIADASDTVSVRIGRNDAETVSRTVLYYGVNQAFTVHARDWPAVHSLVQRRIINPTSAIQRDGRVLSAVLPIHAMGVIDASTIYIALTDGTRIDVLRAPPHTFTVHTNR